MRIYRFTSASYVVAAVCLLFGSHSDRGWAEENGECPTFVCETPGATQEVPLDAAPPIFLPDRGSACTLITFEGYADGMALGTISGPVSVTFGPSWVAVIDSDVGGTGNFANEPSASTTGAFPAAQSSPIDFSPPIQAVEFWYSAAWSSLPFMLKAWDGPGGTGNVVAAETGYMCGGPALGCPWIPCTGDPSGAYCAWWWIGLFTPENSIHSITIEEATPNLWGFDNMNYCLDVATHGACTVPGDYEQCAFTTPENCASLGGIFDAGGVCVVGACRHACSCDETTQSACEASNGEYLGDGTYCGAESECPTVSVWGMAALCLLSFTIGTLALRSRRMSQ